MSSTNVLHLKVNIYIMYNRFFIFTDFFVQDDLVAVFFYDESKASAKVLFIIMVFLYLASVMNLVKWLEFELWMANLSFFGY